MPNHFKARDAKDALQIVQWALSEGAALEIRGRGSKQRLGRPLAVENILDLSQLTGITLYEADELVLSAGVGTPMAEIEAALQAESQELAFEPPNYNTLMGRTDLATDDTNDSGSIGGIVATNLAGPRRLLAGAARDHLLGFEAINGRGEVFKSGGRVVKNVTGYDLSKIMTGSHGTLAALTSVTVKVLPAGQKSRTVLVYGASAQNAAAAHASAGKGPYYISAMAHLPEAAAARSGVDYVKDAGVSVTALRLEGTAVSVHHRTAALRQAMAEYGDTEELHSHRSRIFWRQVRDVGELLPPDMQIWKLSVKPSDGPIHVKALLQQIDGGNAIYDWACGLIWLALPPSDDAHHQTIRAQIGAGGHATLIRASETVRATVPVFQPQPPALAALSARLKQSFDPQAVFNPGRMYPNV
jgi:glycolate oxidase FAD binding subunit